MIEKPERHRLDVEGKLIGESSGVRFIRPPTSADLRKLAAEAVVVDVPAPFKLARKRRRIVRL